MERGARQARPLSAQPMVRVQGEWSGGATVLATPKAHRPAAPAAPPRGGRLVREGPMAPTRRSSHDEVGPAVNRWVLFPWVLFSFFLCRGKRGPQSRATFPGSLPNAGDDDTHGRCAASACGTSLQPTQRGPVPGIFSVVAPSDSIPQPRRAGREGPVLRRRSADKVVPAPDAVSNTRLILRGTCRIICSEASQAEPASERGASENFKR